MFEEGGVLHEKHAKSSQHHIYQRITGVITGFTGVWATSKGLSQNSQ